MSEVTERSAKSADWFSDIPWAADTEQHAAPSAVPRIVLAPTRRRLLQGAAALGSAVALNLLQTVSGFRLGRASAAAGSEYAGHCAGYGTSAGYNDDTLVCVGFPYSYIYCAADGWFINGYRDGGNTQYRPVELCGNGFTPRNAWQWTHGNARYRCADGQFRYYQNPGGWTTWQYRICSQWVASA